VTPEQMLDQAEQTLLDNRAAYAVPRAALSAAWAVLAVATTYVQRTARATEREA